MVEFHGWATVRSRDCGPLSLEDMEALTRMLPLGNMGSGVLDCRAINGEFFLWCAGMPNHRGSEFDAVERLFRQLATAYPGSYGMLYFRDDEDPRSANQFRVLRLLRGLLLEVADTLLSPCVPTIEDE